MRISGYSFGRIEVDGRTYTSDLVIYPDRVESSWWRKEGHRLSLEDLEAVISHKPRILVIGTGSYGVMKVPEGVIGKLASAGIETRVARTAEAAEIFNSVPADVDTVAALHLTC